ncbi:thaumatin-like protein 1b [Iris pallida]|uniref:Thaumatin-like protein 1b n=1 Tax=Iris pallida TaxID=29817 RepID=A0AAX6EBF0_IRIPA|nr:thaumatin-like protein 1b [Iris pallida]
MISPKLVSMGAYFNLILVFNIFLLKGVTSTTFTFKNNCPFTVWPGTLQGGSSSPLSQTGFELGNGATSTPVTAPMVACGLVPGAPLMLLGDSPVRQAIAAQESYRAMVPEVHLR